MRRFQTLFLCILYFLSIQAQGNDFFKRMTFKDSNGKELLYRILYPKSYDKKKSYPLLLFLHGKGERGYDNESQLKYIASLLLSENEKEENEAIVVLPQCPENDSWYPEDLRSNIKTFDSLYVEREYAITDAMQSVSELLDYMMTQPQVRKEQISIMGLSMGALGTLDLLSRRPNTFAKAVPICGGGVMAFAKRYSPYTAIRLYHGSNDTIVSPDLSRALYDRLQILNADVSYKEYAGVGHNSWKYAFQEPDLIQWLTTPSKKINYKQIKDISYSSRQDEYSVERCKLDIYYPVNRKSFSTIVWFHGGGLEGGKKYIPKELMDRGVAVVCVNYRLSPRVAAPEYIDDAALAVSWVFENIKKYGGDTDKIYISGHSAGGYLALMLGLDKQYLGKYNVDVDRVAGLMPISGQTITHNAIRKEMKLQDDIPLVEKHAPLNQIRAGVPPLLLITGDREKELTSRFEENQYLESALKYKGNNVRLYELQGFNHNTVVNPACLLMLKWIEELAK